MHRLHHNLKIISECFKDCPITFDKRLREISFGDLEGICVFDISSEVWEIFNHSPEKLKVEKPHNIVLRLTTFYLLLISCLLSRI